MARLTRCDVCKTELVQGNLHYWLVDYGDRVISDYCEKDFIAAAATDLAVVLSDRGPIRVLREVVS